MTVPAVVVGGGPAGAVAAAALARRGIDVVVLDAARTRPPMGECLPAAAKPVLQRLGVWTRFHDAHHLASPGIASSWGTARLGGRVALTDPYGPGWQIDRQRFEAMCLQLATESGAEVRRGVGVVSVAPRRNGVAVSWRGPSSTGVMTAGFVVDATGRARRVATALGARVEHGDRLVGFATVFADPAAPGSRARVEAFRDGWLYTAAAGTSRRVVICFTDPDLPVARLVRQPGGLAELLTATHYFGDLVGPVGERPVVRAVAAGNVVVDRAARRALGRSR